MHAPSAELMARYAEDPSALTAEERSEVETAAERSPAVADQLRIQIAMAEPLRYQAPPGSTGFAPPQRSLFRGGPTRRAAAPLPTIVALAPDHTGLTVSASPTLYWQLSAPTDRPLHLSLGDPRAQETVLSITLPGPHEAGMGRVDLGRRGARLDRGRTYRWTASVRADDEPGPGDALAVGVIERVARPPGLDQELRRAGPAGAAHVYARRGLWYDAFRAVSRLEASHPREPSLRAARTALLRQVGLGENDSGD